MSQHNSSEGDFRKEKTFSSYNKEQGKAYAQIRSDYHPNVYQAVLDHHTSTGGQLRTLIDVGCGPGTAIASLGPKFDEALGFDPSEGMLANAHSLGVITATSEPVRFEISTAEELGSNIKPPLEDSSVDLIVAANAAHWFDMPRFWHSAARVLKPDGSVILWTSGEITVHPSMPNAAAIQTAMEDHQEYDMKPYFEPGNLLTRNGYRDIILPWTMAQPIRDFDEGRFIRQQWDPAENFFVGMPEADLDVFEKVMASGSAEVRWRQAHPNDVGTERDVLKILRKKIERLLHEAGVEPGEEKIKAAVHGVVLVIKKKA